MKRLCVAALAVSLAACGGSSAPSPSSPSVSAANVSGLWQGTLKYTQCVGMRHCFARIGASDSFTLRVQQAGARVRALFTLSTYVVELNGDVMKDGSVELTGAAPFASESARDFDVAITITRFSAALAPGSRMTGSIGFELRANQTNSEFAVATLAGEIVNTSRTDLTLFTSTVSGTWRGRFIVRSCVPIGPICEWHGVDELGSVELQLTQSGTQVTGTAKMLGDIQITGQTSGRSLTLAGETLTPASGGSSLTRITAWNTSVDDFGRMSGQFEYLFAWPAASPVFGSTARAELWQVVKVP